MCVLRPQHLILEPDCVLKKKPFGAPYFISLKRTLFIFVPGKKRKTNKIWNAFLKFLFFLKWPFLKTCAFKCICGWDILNVIDTRIISPATKSQTLICSPCYLQIEKYISGCPTSHSGGSWGQNPPLERGNHDEMCCGEKHNAISCLEHKLIFSIYQT